MINERMMLEIPAELKKWDDLLFTLARNSIAGDKDEEIRNHKLYEKLMHIGSGAQIIDLPEEKPFVSIKKFKAGKRYKGIIFLAAAFSLILAVLFWRHSVDKVGVCEYRSGLAMIIRSGRSLSSYSVKNIRSGDILETQKGKIAAMIDDRIQLLMNEDTVVHISGKNKIRLDQGNIWVYVLPGSGDFQVHLPRGDIHVVGTSFGVWANSDGVRIRVTTGAVIFRIDAKDAQITAGDELFLPSGKSLSESEKTMQNDMKSPPVWVESLINEMAKERLKKYFPSAVPLEEKK